MNRRTFTKLLAMSPLAILSGRLLASSPGRKTRFLMVFLRGGYDAANLLIPVSSQFYYEARPHIAVAQPGADPGSALPLNADWGLHPALRDSVFPMFARGQAAFIPFAGTNDLSRSHFETQDTIELGSPEGHGRDYRSGFLNRLAAVLQGSSAISFTDQLSLVLQGELAVPNVALRNIGKPAVDARTSTLIASMYRGTRLAGPVEEGFEVRDEVSQAMSTEMEAASRNAISAKGFEVEARRIAKLMHDKYDIGFIDVGGWDTHVGEGGASGYLAGRFEDLGRGLVSFAQELKERWNDTVVVVVSEFGRTFRENGNRGTDHGHGTVYWVLGGSIKGGCIAGEQVRVAQNTLFQNRDFPVLNEYRALLGGLFRRLYGLNSEQLERVFAGVMPRDFGLI